MSTTDHIKLLGMLHIGYGLFNVLVLGILALFVFGIIGVGALASNSEERLGLGIFAVIMLIALGVQLLFTIPEFVAGYALLKRKNWAKTASVVSAILESLSFPIGTAICVYTLWFMFSEQGRQVYEKPMSALPPAPPLWSAAQSRQAEPQYVPPVAPPDWR